jgi:hypothetical protein
VQAPAVQTSGFVHAFPSSHDVPFGWLESGGHVVLAPVQVSSASHWPTADRHVVPALPAVCAQAPAPSHASTLHGLPSVLHGVPLGSKQSSAASLQRSAHSDPAVHGSPVCPQVPPLQVSVPVQKSPSSHGAVFAGWMHVPVPLQ